MVPTFRRRMPRLLPASAPNTPARSEIDNRAPWPRWPSRMRAARGLTSLAGFVKILSLRPSGGLAHTGRMRGIWIAVFRDVQVLDVTGLHRQPFRRRADTRVRRVHRGREARAGDHVEGAHPGGPAQTRRPDGRARHVTGRRRSRHERGDARQKIVEAQRVEAPGGCSRVPGVAWTRSPTCGFARGGDSPALPPRPARPSRPASPPLRAS
jgi:hypothetical protein